MTDKKSKPIILFAPDYGGAATKAVENAGAIVANTGKTFAEDLDNLVALLK